MLITLQQYAHPRNSADHYSIIQIDFMFEEAPASSNCKQAGLSTCKHKKR